MRILFIAIYRTFKGRSEPCVGPVSTLCEIFGIDEIVQRSRGIDRVPKCTIEIIVDLLLASG